MKHSPKKRLSGHKLMAALCAGALAVMSGVLLALYYATGYHGLLLAALVQLLPAAVQLSLLLPVGKQIQLPPEGEPEEEKKHKLRHLLKKLRVAFLTWYPKGRNGIVTALICVAVVAIHLVYWKAAPAGSETLNYLIPVLLLVVFVVSIVLETWCRLSLNDPEGERSAYLTAMIRSAQSALVMGMAAQLLCAVSITVRLLGLYDAGWLLKILLGVLFVYESVFIAFSLAVRVIRHELHTAPEFLIALPGAKGADMHILQYLEENTGITMRSLWSMKLVKKLLPGAAMCVALLVWLSTGVVQIQSHQEGALYRLGKMNSKILQPGIHLTLPWPFDRVDVYNTRTVQRVTIGYVPTGDQSNVWTEAHGSEEYRFLLNGYDEQAEEQSTAGPGSFELISINMQIEYRITDLPSYIRYCADPEALLQAKAYEIITARTSNSDLNTLLSVDREKFAEEFQLDLEEKITQYQTGISVENVILESIHPPVEVALVYQRLISAGIDAEHLILQAEKEADALIMDAKNQKLAKVGDALVTKHQAIGNAESEVAAFMASVAADNAYRTQYRYYKYMNALTQAYANAKLIIVGDGVDSSQIYLGSLTGETVEEPTLYLDGEDTMEEDF